jgi:uncharacterized Zn-finger protein
VVWQLILIIMTMVIANWRIRCNVYCPYCDTIIDLYGEITDSFEFLPAPGHSEDIDAEIECPKCEREFYIQRVEH